MAAALRRSAFTLARALESNVSKELPDLVQRKRDGKLTRSSERAIRRAFREASREHKRARAVRGVAKKIREHVDRVERLARRELVGSVLAVTDSPRAARRVRELAEGAKVGGARKRLSKRLGGLSASLRDDTIARGQRDVLEILNRGGDPSRAIARLEELADQARRRADRIAVNETGTGQAQITRHLHAAAGVDSYRWRGQLDDREREEHVAREGVRFTWTDPPWDGHPGEPANCRCEAEPVLPDTIAGEEDEEP